MDFYELKCYGFLLVEKLGPHPIISLRLDAKKYL